MIGVHSIWVVGDDISCLVDTVDIQHGRDDSTQQPAASSCTVNLDLSETALPVDVEIGSQLRVYTENPPGHVTTRFQGTITDITLGWDDAGEDTPNAGIGQLIAVGPLAGIGRRVVGDAPMPQELDGARVARVMALAGVTLDPLYSDPGTVQILPRDIDSTDALSVATDAAQSAMGVIWETRDGFIRYADANHRRNIPSSLVLDACDVLVTPSWSRTLEGLTNKVSLGYGVAAEGESDQPRVYAQDDASIAKLGTFEYSLSTFLANANDAQVLASYLVVMNGQPVWLMTELPLDVAGLDAATTQTLLAFDMHTLITLTGLPVIAAGGVTTANLWLEGWKEHLEYGGHDLTLSVSGYCRTAPPPRWNDLLPAQTWDSMGSITWNGISCLGPPVDIGRWDDVAASTRWDAVPASIHWDEWSN